MKTGLILGLVGGTVLVAVIAGVAFAQRAPAAGPTKAPKKPAAKSSTAATPGITLGKEDKSKGLTNDELLSLANDSVDLLAAWGEVSPHKNYVAGIANRLAEEGDSRAATINARLGNWQGPVTYASLIDPEASIVATPLNYTYDQIFDVAGASNFVHFKNWAAQYLKAAGRTEQSSILLEQIAAIPKEST